MARSHGRSIGCIAVAVLALASIFTLGGCSLITPTLAEVTPTTARPKVSAPAVSSDGELLIGIPSSDAPQIITDDTGTLTGYTVDVGRALAQKLGLTPVFLTGADPSKIGTAGAPDIYLGAEERGLSSGLSLKGVFLEDAPALFAQDRTSTEAPSLQDLSTATIAVQVGSTAQDVLAKAGIEATQKTYANVNESLAAVARGEADFAACDATSGGYLSRAYPGMSFVCTLDEAASYGVAVKTSNDTLAREVESALSALEGDGSLEAIHRAWYGGLPVSLSGSLLTGATTSSERAAARTSASSAQ